MCIHYVRKCAHTPFAQMELQVHATISSFPLPLTSRTFSYTSCQNLLEKVHEALVAMNAYGPSAIEFAGTILNPLFCQQKFQRS